MASQDLFIDRHKVSYLVLIILNSAVLRKYGAFTHGDFVSKLYVEIEWEINKSV